MGSFGGKGLGGGEIDREGGRGEGLGGKGGVWGGLGWRVDWLKRVYQLAIGAIGNGKWNEPRGLVP